MGKVFNCLTLSMKLSWNIKNGKVESVNFLDF